MTTSFADARGWYPRSVAKQDIVGRVALLGAVVAGAAIVETALVPGLLIGGAAVLAPRLLPAAYCADWRTGCGGLRGRW